MKLSSNGIVCLLFLVPIFTQAVLSSAVHHICDLGKSKTYRKKAKNKIHPFQKILLIGCLEDCKHFVAQARRLRNVYWVDMVYQAGCIFCWLVSKLYAPAGIVLFYLICVRLMVLDIPVFVFFFLMTKHGKNGGVTWRWEA